MGQLFQSLSSWAFLGLGLIIIPLTTALGIWFYITPHVLKDSRRRHLPPGPRGLPFLGNYRDIGDIDKFHIKALEWTKKYGEIFHVNLLGSDFIFLSSPRTVKALMDQRSAIYSSRPPAPLAQDVASAGRRQLFMQYGPKYREVRKMAHALLNTTVSPTYLPVQDLESKRLLFDMLNEPDEFYDHNRRYAASVIITATYGHRIDSWDHPLAKKIYSVLNNLQQFMTPGDWLVDTLPALSYLPEQLFGNWRAFGKKCFDHDHKVYLGLWENLKQEVKEGKAHDCFCKRFYENDPEKNGLDNLQAAYMAGGFVEAGSETTSALLNAWVLLITLHPEVQAKAQEEMDAVVGPDRLPVWADEAKLPYLRAMIKETLRLRPANKFGMNHYTSADDWFEGMFIPKNTTIVLNWW